MPASDYQPDVAAVASYILSRTKTEGGSEAGTFNLDADHPKGDPLHTRPTGEQVETIIEQALGKISGKIGADIDEAYWPTANRLTALYAAMLTELKYWPEQINTGRSTYPQLKELFDEDWEEFLDVLGIGEKDGGGPASIDAGFPSYGGFPTTAIGMETAW